MAQLAVSILSNDEQCKREMARMLRASGVPVGDRRGAARRRRRRARRLHRRHPHRRVVRHGDDRAAAGRRTPHVAIFAVAGTSEPDLILQAMRAGANEFFPWSSRGMARSTEESSRERSARPRHAATRPPPAPASPASRTCSSAPRAAPARRPSRSTARWSWHG